MLLDPIGGGRFIAADDRIMTWVAEHIDGIPSDYVWEYGRAIGLVSGGEIIAGMVVHDYVAHYRHCQVTFAAEHPRWATKDSIKAMLRYPLEQLGCERITTICAETNERAIRFCEGIGFVREGVLRHGCGAQNAIVMGLLKADAPSWMGFTTFH